MEPSGDLDSGGKERITVQAAKNSDGVRQPWEPRRLRRVPKEATLGLSLEGQVGVGRGKKRGKESQSGQTTQLLNSLTHSGLSGAPAQKEVS